MVMYEAGMLARSKAGHDKAQMYIIKEAGSARMKGDLANARSLQTFQKMQSN